MTLNERKVKILEAIINDYIRTAEPIGSRTIAKKYDLGISSATIRNEMSDLEEMGFIVQPHASAGRVPSDKGYRLYVDELMRYKELTMEESAFLQQLVMKNMSQIDYLMQETARALAVLTRYTTIVSEPQMKKTKVKHVQFVPVDETTIVMVLVTDNKVAKNHTIKLSKALDFDTLNQLSSLFSGYFQGCSTHEMTSKAPDTMVQIAKDTGVDADLLEHLVTMLLYAMQTEESIQVYTSGANNILGFPEFSDLDKARGIFQALEEKDMLITLLDHQVGHVNDDSTSIKVIIGAENSLEELRNCSIIKADYKLGDQVCGSIGIIGPTRMDYPQVVSVLTTIVKNINSVLKALSGG